MVGCGDKAVDQSEETKNPAQETVQSEVSNNENGEDTIKEASANTISDMELGELSEEQIDIFKSVAHEFIDNVLNGEMTVSEMIDSQLFILDTYVMSNELPQNGAKLFGEWKTSVNYYELLAEWLVNNGLSGVEDIMPNIPTDEEVNETQQQETVVTPQQNKPQPSEKQEQTQKQEVTSKPIKPSNNTPKEEVVGTPGESVTASGGSAPTKAEDTGNTFEDSVIRAVMATYGVSRAEAERMIANGEI